MEHGGGGRRSATCTGGATSWPLGAARNRGCPTSALAQPALLDVATSADRGSRLAATVFHFILATTIQAAKEYQSSLPATVPA